MEAKTIITIGKQDIINMLRAQGYGVEDTQEFYHEDYDIRTPVCFPIKMDMAANVAPTASCTIKKAVPLELMNLVGLILYTSNNRIDCIRQLRAQMGWPLKEAKDWLDDHFPQPARG